MSRPSRRAPICCRWRAATWRPGGSPCWPIPTAPTGDAAEILALAERTERHEALAAAELCKLAGLLPAAVCLPPSGARARGRGAGRRGPPYRELVASSLRPVSEARVPLADAEDVRIVAFRPADGGPEQLAILVGEPEAAPAPLAGCTRSASPAISWARCAATAATSCVAPSAGWRGGRRRAALSGPGGPRHRARQQAARLHAAGRRARHRRRQQASRLRPRRARLLGGRGHAAPARHRPRPPADQQPGQDRASSTATASRSPAACRTSSRPTSTTAATC